MIFGTNGNARSVGSLARPSFCYNVRNFPQIRGDLLFFPFTLIVVPLWLLPTFIPAYSFPLNFLNMLYDADISPLPESFCSLEEILVFGFIFLVRIADIINFFIVSP